MYQCSIGCQDIGLPCIQTCSVHQFNSTQRNWEMVFTPKRQHCEFDWESVGCCTSYLSPWDTEHSVSWRISVSVQFTVSLQLVKQSEKGTASGCGCGQGTGAFWLKTFQCQVFHDGSTWWKIWVGAGCVFPRNESEAVLWWYRRTSEAECNVYTTGYDKETFIWRDHSTSAGFIVSLYFISWKCPTKQKYIILTRIWGGAPCTGESHGQFLFDVKLRETEQKRGCHTVDLYCHKTSVCMSVNIAQ